MALPRRIYRSARQRIWNRLYGPAVQASLKRLMSDLAAHPNNPDAHYRLAHFYFEQGDPLKAIAECRTSLTFGGGGPARDLLSTAYASRDYEGEGIFSLPPFVYQRIKSLASKINECFPDRHPRVLDVGGGDGFLSLFLREGDYALAEPSVNGLLVTHFPKGSFDMVVACHVFEHIPADQKDEFLQNLCSVTRHRVLLLGPFETGAQIADATPLIYQITRAPWAREHLECGTPSLDMITRFAAQHGLSCTVSPSGNRMSVYWALFAGYFAQCAGRGEDLHLIEKFANKHLNTDVVNTADPNEYMVELVVDGRSFS